MPTPTADSSDLTDQYNTKLAPDQEAKFAAWAKALGEQGSSYDYDLRGAYSAGAGQAANGHFPDTFKKPNHPTFSDQSKYHTEQTQGGKWEQQPDKSWSFTPSQYQLQQHTPEDLQSYFARVEKGNKLVLPQKPTALDAINEALRTLGGGGIAL